MSVGYYFSSASSQVMRVRQVVFASAPAFSKLGLCVLDRMGPGEGGVEEPAAMTGADHIHSQHMCARPEITAKTPPSMSYARGNASHSGPDPGHLHCGPRFRDSLAPGSDLLPSR